MWICVLLALVGLLLDVTDGPPIEVKVTEYVTACPLTNAVFELKVTDPSDQCMWVKDGILLLDNRETTYSIKRHENHEKFIILFVSEKDNGKYECHIELPDGSYKYKDFKLNVSSEEECNNTQVNNPANNVGGVNNADIIAAVFSPLSTLLSGGCLLMLCRLCHSRRQESSYNGSEEEMAKLDEVNAKSSPVETSPIQVFDGNEIEIEERNE